MKTYYLMLKAHNQSKPSLIKKCQATSKIFAAITFMEKLNNFNRKPLFNSEELITSIKSEKELNEEERSWIKAEDEEFLEL